MHWYGLMYLVGLGLIWHAGRWAIGRGLTPITRQQLEDLIFWGMLGAILGGRLGYVLFYKPAEYLANPAGILAIWQGGMSFHGGLLGVILVLVLYARSRKLSLWAVGDLAAITVPLALGAGRIGNFINGELWGRATDLPWGMVFPQALDGIARHPSQLYQAFLEGLLLSSIAAILAVRRVLAPGQLAGVFLVGYGLVRFMIEFTREPDSHLGLLALGLSMGQWLSLPMILAGSALFVLRRKHP